MANIERAKAEVRRAALPVVADVFRELGASGVLAHMRSARIDFADRTFIRELLVAVERAQDSAARDSDEALDQVSRDTLTGLLRLRSMKWGTQWSDALDFFQIWVSIAPIAQAATTRRLAPAHDWIIHALDSQLVNTSTGREVEVHLRPHRLLRLAFPSELISSLDSRRFLCEWLIVYSYYSRLRSVLHEALIPVIAPVLEWLVNEAPRAAAVEAVTHLLPWIRTYAPQHAAAASIFLCDNAFSPVVPRKVRKEVNILLSSGRSEGSLISPSDRAITALEAFGDILEGHERLHLLLSAIGSDAPELVRREPDICAAIDELTRAFRAVGVNPRSWEAGYARGPLFDILAPALATLLKAGHASLVVRLLHRWEAREAPARGGRPLVVVPATDDGTLYVVDGEVSEPNDSDTVPSLTDVMERYNLFTGKLLSSAEVPTYRPAAPRDLNFVERSMAGEFIQLSERRLQGARATPFFATARPVDYFVCIPFSEMPLQPLLLKATGRTLPWALSLEAPATDRPLTKAAVISAGTQYSELERELVSSALTAAGVQVDLLGEGDISVERVVAIYGSAEYDLVWIGGHGEFDAYNPHRSYIDFGDGVRVPQEALSFQGGSDDRRRLLVLNLCDGATVAALGGMPEVGIAASACGRNQAVISHLWASHALAAAATGILLAGELGARMNFFVAYEQTLKVLIAGRATAADRISVLFGENCALLERLERSSVAFPEAADWASLAFYE